MSLLDYHNIPKHNLSVYIIADGSQNMKDVRIGALNDAIENIMPVFREIVSENPDMNLIIKVLLVNDNPKIKFSSESNGFVWQNVEASGDFYFGRALICLTDDIKRNFQPENFDPIFVLLTSSPSSDLWQFYLKRLYNICAFDYGHKIAISIGDNVDFGMLRSFTKCDNHIFSVHNIDKLKDVIRITWSYPEWEICSNDNFEKCVGDIGLIIDQAVTLFGKEILFSSRIVNIMNDYHAFDSDSSKLFIFKTIQSDSHFKSLINSKSWYLDSVSFCARVAHNTGIDILKLQDVINAIGFGLKHTIYN